LNIALAIKAIITDNFSKMSFPPAFEFFSYLFEYKYFFAIGNILLVSIFILPISILIYTNIKGLMKAFSNTSPIIMKESKDYKSIILLDGVRGSMKSKRSRKDNKILLIEKNFN